MLLLSHDIVSAIFDQARQAHPIECCGIIAAAAGSERATRLIPMVNRARSEVYFEFDPRQQLQVWREMDARNEEPRVFYHSHTASRAFPSATDIAFATDANAHYLIVSTADYDPPLRSFRIVQGCVSEEEVRIDALPVAALNLPD